MSPLTAEQRDGARRFAQERVDYSAMHAPGREPGTVWRAVLAFVPPGKATPPQGFGVEVSMGTSFISRRGYGTIPVDSLADAERLAWAILAAVAVARTTDDAAGGGGR